jgi:cytochrome c biogenesis protein CcmG/thiol:disulfide interchange protein DsbE
MIRYLIPLGIFTFLVGLFLVGLQHDPRIVPSPLINKPSPQFDLPRLEDPKSSISKNDLMGKVVFLNVWASWCVECRREHPVLLQLAKTKRFNIVGLNYKDTRADAMRWLEQHGDPYQTSAFDQAGQVGIDFGVYGVPETFILDRKGIIRYKRIGPITPEVLETDILPLIKKLNVES